MAIKEDVSNTQSLFVLKYDPSPRESPSSSFFEYVEPFELLGPDSCKACNGAIGSSWLKPPLRYEIEIEGKSIGDILFGPGRHILVSAKFMAEFCKSGLKGILSFQTTEIVSMKKRKKIVSLSSEYFFPTILKIGRIDVNKSGLEAPPDCDVCLSSPRYKRIRRIILESNSWGDNDIFSPFGALGKVLVSKKFKGFCINSGITNAVFIPAEEFSEDYYPWEKKTEEGINQKAPPILPVATSKTKNPPFEIKVMGVYPLKYTEEMFKEQLELLYGADSNKEYSKKQMREQMDSTVLIELFVHNKDGQFNLQEISSVAGQAPWAEVYLSPDGNAKIEWEDLKAPKEEIFRVAFYICCWNPDQPIIKTPIGDIICPKLKDMPKSLIQLAPWEMLD